MNYNPNTYRLCGGFTTPAKLKGIPVVSTEPGGALGNFINTLECGCRLEWYPHSLRAVDSCLIHAGYLVLDDLEPTADIPLGANICDWFRQVGEDTPHNDAYGPAFPIWEYRGDDVDGIGIKWLVKGHRYLVI